MYIERTCLRGVPGRGRGKENDRKQLTLKYIAPVLEGGIIKALKYVDNGVGEKDKEG
jgi:hypothetical protein